METFDVALALALALTLAVALALALSLQCFVCGIVCFYVVSCAFVYVLGVFGHFYAFL